ncbi:nucleotidyltransferase substrate binding protein (TIGR01987 family) [Maribacter caenipelagi]|uniref:Nucleotidyltransferase substrate binding protein (TIGR01987 family) n=1 Tax=Maribacter caenipelagi TaxID=1447781 RepID=A0A4R7DFT8_9FLAO|nr:nucleotidyltransferase substrate binding protein [Maribacter caenipelagi]TDS18884.1 nucleotidyltransferase substrate binding protein (TIGR01987 family) [Maribacter caenipelagi]
MSKEDIRWEQRFSNYVKAFNKLDQAVTKIKEDYAVDEDGNIDDDEFLDDIIKEGVIKRFEYTHEIAWNVMKDYAEFQGNTNVGGSRDAVREAFKIGLIPNGKIWMEMIISRNKTSHTYNEETADEIFNLVINDYHYVFKAFLTTMEEKRSGEQEKLFEEE